MSVNLSTSQNKGWNTDAGLFFGGPLAGFLCGRRGVSGRFFQIGLLLVIIDRAAEEDFAAFEMPVHVACEPEAVGSPLAFETVFETPDRTDQAAEDIHLVGQM